MHLYQQHVYINIRLPWIFKSQHIFIFVRFIARLACSNTKALKADEPRADCEKIKPDEKINVSQAHCFVLTCKIAEGERILREDPARKNTKPFPRQQMYTQWGCSG